LNLGEQTILLFFIQNAVLPQPEEVLPGGLNGGFNSTEDEIRPAVEAANEPRRAALNHFAM
jgi:hypothetical protein